MEPYGPIVEQYRDFGASAPESPCFVEWSQGVVDDPKVQAWIARLPGIKQQPNLVFAAARWHGVPAPGPYRGLRSALLDDDGSIVDTIMSRSTQTNEAGRSATLVPLLWRIQQQSGRPLALLEVGASAGLNLYPDAWRYRYATPAGEVVVGSADAIGELGCRVTGELPPLSVPEIGWRGGIDLNPLDVDDDDQMQWLVTLVWPEDDARRERLRTAIEVARSSAERPHVVAGDLLEQLPQALMAASSQGHQVVVFHSAVIAYLDNPERHRFHGLMTSLVAAGRCRWISNESPKVLPRVSAPLTGQPPPGAFVLGLDGRPVALTHGHGATLTWIP